jgi:hypothetical protein
MRGVLAFLFLIILTSSPSVIATRPIATEGSKSVTDRLDKPVTRVITRRYAILPSGVSLEPTPEASESNLQDKDDLIRRILSDAKLWGKDFPLVLASLPGFNRAGEKEITVLPNRIVGERRFKSLDEAGREAADVSKYLSSGQNKFRPDFQELFQRGFRERVATLKPQPLNFLDDDTKRVAILSRESQFLAPGLTIATVRQVLGEPEKITREVLDNGERRPIILKIHHYAGGAIAFAESNWTTRPGDIDRAFLNVPAVTAAVFQETR